MAICDELVHYDTLLHVSVYISEKHVLFYIDANLCRNSLKK